MNDQTNGPIASQSGSPDVTPAKEYGPSVLYGQIFFYAKPKCSTCFGRGQIQITEKLFQRGKDGKPKEVPIVGKTRSARAKACGCAMRRFMGEHKNSVELDPEGNLCWKTTSPEGIAHAEALRRKNEPTGGTVAP